MNKTVMFVREKNLCISCGICAAVCPCKCISYAHKMGMNLPVIDSEKCTQCGKCFEVCPGKGFNYRERGDSFDAHFGLRNAKGIYIARTRDENTLMNAASGGIITELISCMLRDGEYDNAFVVRGYDYSDEVISTKKISRDSDIHDSQRSRYVVISHRECAKYMLNNPDAKLILTGTSCFTHGIMNLIRIFGLERRNYFIIGLFCDKTMNMNVIQYFRNHERVTHGIKEFHFRSKDSGGWPGGVRIIENDGNVIDMANTERMKVKDYFQPERCLYCLDKLNMYADISVGDNYTGRHSDKNGSSSVIIRTDEGLRIWEKYKDRPDVYESCGEEIAQSQHIKARGKNYMFGEIKSRIINHVINDIQNDTGLNDSAEYEKEYAQRLEKIRTGAEYEEHPDALMKKLRADKKKPALRKIKSAVKRIIKKFLFIR